MGTISQIARSPGSCRRQADEEMPNIASSAFRKVHVGQDVATSEQPQAEHYQLREEDAVLVVRLP